MAQECMAQRAKLAHDVRGAAFMRAAGTIQVFSVKLNSDQRAFSTSPELAAVRMQNSSALAEIDPKPCRRTVLLRPSAATSEGSTET
jgi:hypothetical protein